MDIVLSEEQVAVRDLVRRVAAERVAPRAAAIDASGEYPQDMFDLLRELGLFTLPFPPEYGGEHGGMGSHLAACVAVEEFGRVCYNTAYLLVVQWLPICALLAAGSEAQKRRFLPGLADGSLRAAFSTTEAQSGSDIQGIRTRARREGNGLAAFGAEDLVHQRRTGGFRCGGGPNRHDAHGGGRAGCRQLLRGGERDEGIQRRAQGGEDGGAGRAVLAAVLR